MRDAIGFARVNLPRYTAIGQWRAMVLHGVRTVIHKGGGLRTVDSVPELQVIAGDLPDVLRMVTKGRVIAVQYAHLLANPELRNVRGATRKDFWRVFDAIEEKGGVLWELSTDLRTNNPKQRDAMTRAAIDALALGRHRASRSDKRGRPRKVFDDATIDAGRAVWESRRYRRWKDAAKRLPKGMTMADAYELYGPRNVEDDEQK